MEENRIALNHRPKQYSYEEQFSIPGGGTEENENITDTLHREALEEIGVDIKDIKEKRGSNCFAKTRSLLVLNLVLDKKL